MTERNAGGLRRGPHRELSQNEIEHIKNEIKAISADESVFVFNQGRQTGYIDRRDVIVVRYDVFPDANSIHPRDLMSERAVLAHEYYGHRHNRGTKLDKGCWNDEFRASYTAAVSAPNLSDEDRQYLVLDALQRAKEAGVTVTHNEFIRRTLHGY